MGESIGCLLIGQTAHGSMRALRERLNARGIATVDARRGDNLLSAAQEGLYAARRPGGTCVAAEGEYWAAALALAVQLNVERVALLAPTDIPGAANDSGARQMERLKGYVRRNLFFCVSDVLVLEGQADERSARRMDAVLRKLCNARVRRTPVSNFLPEGGCYGAPLAAGEWPPEPIDAVVRFLEEGHLSTAPQNGPGRVRAGLRFG